MISYKMGGFVCIMQKHRKTKCNYDQFILLFQYCPDKWWMCMRECDAVNMLTQVWAGPLDPPHCPPSGRKTPPAGWDPPSIRYMKKNSVTHWWSVGVWTLRRRRSKPHQRTAAFGGGCVWAPSAPGSSSSGPPGWCWSPSVRSQASRRWPASRSQWAAWIQHEHCALNNVHRHCGILHVVYSVYKHVNAWTLKN